MAIEIVDFPIENCGSFHSYVNVYQRVIEFHRTFERLNRCFLGLVFAPPKKNRFENRCTQNKRSSHPRTTSDNCKVAILATVSMEPSRVEVLFVRLGMFFPFNSRWCHFTAPIQISSWVRIALPSQLSLFGLTPLDKYKYMLFIWSYPPSIKPPKNNPKYVEITY